MKTIHLNEDPKDFLHKKLGRGWYLKAGPTETFGIPSPDTFLQLDSKASSFGIAYLLTQLSFDSPLIIGLLLTNANATS